MKIRDWMASSADFMGPGAIHLPAHHGAVISKHMKKMKLRTRIAADSSSSDFNRTHLWEEPSSTDITARNWRTKRDYEKTKGRNADPFEDQAELHAAAAGPCGCTLKIGQEAIVEGGVRGVIIERSSRVLTIAKKDGSAIKVDQNFVHHVQAKKGFAASE